MKKVIIIIDSLGSGGAEKSLINLLSLIDYSKFNVDLALFGRGGINEKFVPDEVNILPLIHPSATGNPLKRLGLRMAQLAFSISLRINKPKTSNDQAIRYWKYFKNYLPPLNNNYDVAFAYAQRIPTIFTAKKVKAQHKFAWINVTIHHNSRLRNFYLKSFKEFKKIICVSKDVEETVVESYPELKDKTKVIYDIINPGFIKGLSNEYIPFLKEDSTIDILTVARLNFRQKGYDILLKACRILKEKGYKFVWRALGNGDKENKIRELIEIYGLEGYFELCGVNSNPYPYFAHSDLYVQTSRYEGYGLSIAEARLLGLPVVSTPYDCVNLQIKDGENGIISTFNPEDIAASIANLIDNTKKYDTIKKNLEKDKIGNLEEFSKIDYLLNYED